MNFKKILKKIIYFSLFLLLFIIAKEFFYNGFVRMRENDVEIFKLREKGETLASIAKKYNVSPQAISSILKKTKNI